MLENMLQKSKNRFLELDIIRSVCILLMVLDHFAFFCLNFALQRHQMRVYDAAIYNYLRMFLTNDVRIYVRYIVLSFFFCISGICTQLTKNNLRRSGKLALMAVAITIFSIALSQLVSIDFIVYFGVIHFYAVAVFLCFAIETIKSIKLKYGIYLALIFISILFIFINPKNYQHNYFMFLGISHISYVPSFDYFPIFPNIGFFVIGIFVGKFYYKKSSVKNYKILSNPVFYPFLTIGEHGKLIYALHIPIILVLSYIISVIVL